MTFRGILVDDVPDEASTYAEQMSTRGVLKIESQGPDPVSKHSREIFCSTPDILILDYRLDEELGDMDANEAFKASAMAQQLRDLAIESPDLDFPIVLISTEENILKFYEPDQTSHDLFDHLYTKESINSDRSRVREQMISLCDGYHVLREQLPNCSLVELTGLDPQSEQHVIDYQELTLPVSRAAAPHILAKILFHQLISRSGLLIDADHACAWLGVSRTQDEQIARALTEQSAGYQGVFSAGWPSFWAHRVDEAARKWFGARATGITSGERADLLSKKLGFDLEPAASPWTKKTDELIAFPCACCKNGTELRHSVGVFEGPIPSFSMRRRICWRCISDDRHLNVDPVLTLDSLDQDLVESVRKLSVPE